MKNHRTRGRNVSLSPGLLPLLWAAVGLILIAGTVTCSAPTPPPTLTPTSTALLLPTSTPVPILTPTPEVQCIPWYEAPNHVGETTCVEGQIFQMRNANAPRFAFMLFDPTFSIDDCCGKFYAWIRSDDWCEYFSDCREGPGMSTELDGKCVHVFGAVEKKMGRVRTEVTERSQIEFIDCQACQTDACALRQ